MAVVVQHRRLMLLCACCDEKVRDRQTMPAAPADRPLQTCQRGALAIPAATRLLLELVEV